MLRVRAVAASCATNVMGNQHQQKRHFSRASQNMFKLHNTKLKTRDRDKPIPMSAQHIKMFEEVIMAYDTTPMLKPHQGDDLQAKNMFDQMSKEREERRCADIVYKQGLGTAAIMALPTKFLNDASRAMFLTRVPTYRQLYFTPPRHKVTDFVSLKLQKIGRANK